jgi:putative DNA primase/helicase
MRTDSYVKRGGMKANNDTEAKRQFIAVMSRHSLALSRGDGLIADGEIHRCDVAGKGNSGRGDGSYVLHLDGLIPYGGFQNWTNGRDWQSWRLDLGRKLTIDEQREVDRSIKAAGSGHEAYLAKVRTEARIKAKKLWRSAEQAPDRHEYCEPKKVKPHGLKVMRLKDGDTPLLVPMRDENGKLQNLQFIHNDGRKHGLKGGRQGNCHYWVAKPDEAETDRKIILVTEGWATGESVYQATGASVIIAFSANNLRSVTEWVQKRHPDYEIIICADDDWRVKGNPGLSKAKEAAKAVDGLIAIPNFDMESRRDHDTDFNDLHVAAGRDVVKHAIDNAVAPEQIDPSDDGADEQKKQREKQTPALLKLIPTAGAGGLFRTKDNVGMPTYSSMVTVKPGASSLRASVPARGAARAHGRPV